jgi:hypothetical protein
VLAVPGDPLLDLVLVGQAADLVLAQQGVGRGVGLGQGDERVGEAREGIEDAGGQDALRQLAQRTTWARASNVTRST